MSIPLFYPPVRYLPRLQLSERATSLRELCGIAGVACKASGAWTDRVVDLSFAADLQIFAEPGDWSTVQITMPVDTPCNAARLALAVMAYALHDLVARQSIQGAPWARVAPPRGRIATGAALTTTERQRRFRAQH